MHEFKNKKLLTIRRKFQLLKELQFFKENCCSFWVCYTSFIFELRFSQHYKSVSMLKFAIQKFFFNMERFPRYLTSKWLPTTRNSCVILVFWKFNNIENEILPRVVVVALRKNSPRVVIILIHGLASAAISTCKGEWHVRLLCDIFNNRFRNKRNANCEKNEGVRFLEFYESNGFKLNDLPRSNFCSIL